jgi:DNA-binding NtrC family response regulator
MPDRATSGRSSGGPATSRDRGAAPALAALIVEDSSRDVERVVGALEAAGYLPLHWRRVEDAAGMKTALSEEIWDVVISEHRMPAFAFRHALAVLRDSGAKAPLIVVSGKIADGVAMAGYQAGAADWVSNDRFDRLGSAVVRCLLRRGDERRP